MAVYKPSLSLSLSKESVKRQTIPEQQVENVIVEEGNCLQTNESGNLVANVIVEEGNCLKTNEYGNLVANVIVEGRVIVGVIVREIKSK